MTLRSSLPLHLLGAALSALVIACTSDAATKVGDDAGGSGACPVATACDAGAAGFATAGVCTPCSSGAPSYQNDIAPILAGSCVPCHGPSGTAGYDETSYALVVDQASPMLDMVAGCEMPPVNGPAFDTAQRIALTSWLVCGAPNN